MAVANQADNPGLMRDCITLLGLMDTLRGTVALDWAATSAITGWEGITTSGIPSRVTKLLLSGESLSGTTPASLGRLSELTHLNLSSNSLTGSIPHELGWLNNLEELRLSGNSLTGCIPLALKDVATNDLSALNLLYCQPPAPDNLMAGTVGETSIPLSWDMVTNASKYRVEYRLQGDLNWSVDSDAITDSTHTVDDLVCDSEYQFRVRAYGSGTEYAPAWSDETLLFETTTECMSPVFEEAEYTFELAEDASASDAVVTVSATHPDDDSITYSITAGNTGTAFAIGTSSGTITVAGALDYETTPSYTLTVQAEDDDENTDTVEVIVTVTDVVEDPPPAPTGVSASLADGSFTVTWTSLEGAAKYEAQHKTDAVDSEWTALPETTGMSATYTPEGGPECGTEYQFQVRAYGDGETYTEMWGDESNVETVETANCVPEFDQNTYTFEVVEDADVGHVVGTVSATDEDTGDTLTYTTESGNTGGVFTIGSATGIITVGDDLDHETTPSYTLTVQVDDGNGGTDTATVTISVTDVAEDPPLAPSGLAVSLTGGTFSVSWTALDGAARYEVQHKTDKVDSDWSALPEVTGTNATYTPLGGPDCSTRYQFRVRAYGDGDTYTEMWGVESEEESVETATCNPEFDSATYSFNLSDGSSTGHAVGSVSATDPDIGDTLTYSIESGNTGNAFAIDSSTGAITIAGTLDYETTSGYSFTVEVDDGNGGTDTATVTISRTLAECLNGTVVPRPGQNPLLVPDCSILLSAKDTLAGSGTLNWSENLVMSGWNGVSLDSVPSLYVRDLLLTDMGLTGTMPASYGGLVDLLRLDLGENELTGDIPSELGNMESLKQLHLFDNRLTGSIPSELSRLDNLSHLYLIGNRLSGTIPAGLAEMSRLRMLLLDNNQLTGAIPAVVGGMDSLEQLWLSPNPPKK